MVRILIVQLSFFFFAGHGFYKQEARENFLLTVEGKYGKNILTLVSKILVALSVVVDFLEQIE